MKITDIINEDVDMSWWAEEDKRFNPEAHDYAQKQVKRDNILGQSSDDTKVFTKPLRKSQEPFSNQPKGEQPSPGHVGNVDVQVRAKHISKEEGEDLI